MKHAVLNVYEIKTPSNEYVTFKGKLNKQSEVIVICADIGSGISFMNESLLPKEVNLYEQLDTVPSITARDMFDKMIIDKRMHLAIHLVDSNVTLQARPYVTKGIKAGLILDNDVLGLPQNKISLHLHNKKMQIKAIQVSLKFTSSSAAPISFNVSSISWLKSCLKVPALSRPPAAKTVRFEASIWSSRRYVSGLPLKIAAENATEISEWRRHASPTNQGNPAPLRRHQHDRCTKAWAPRRRRLEEPWRRRSTIPWTSPFFSKKVAFRQNFPLLHA